MKITILGSGSAAGVPSVSGGWGKCDPLNPKNHRRRVSILVEEGPTTILVDTSPDLREQMLDAKLRRLDAVIYTHAHADHLHGLDELREMCRISQGPLQAYATPETMKKIEGRFGYAFEGIPAGKPVFRPWLIPNLIEPAEKFAIGNIAVTSFLQDHGYGGTTLGFAFGDHASGHVVYSTDLVDLPPASKAAIKGAKLWILGVLGDMPYPTHVHVAKALEWIAELKPHRTVIIHMSNALDYDTLAVTLPVGVTPGYDGMVIEV